MNETARYAPDLLWASAENTYYALTMFPYPSGSGLHCGHASIFTINDVIARVKRMQWYAVLNPFGFDAFGLPTENYAIQQWKPAREVTDINKQHFLNQIQALNMSFDMSRVIDTSTPEYYKWTQWIFAKLYEAWLVYKDTLWVNRCPVDLTVLANDQVVDGKCERCKTEIIQKKHPQWFIKITDYADRLLEDLDTIDRPEETKTTQRNRIGRSEWAEIDFMVVQWEKQEKITCFTTRADTIYGVTWLVLAPENMLLDELLDADTMTAVQQYRDQTLAKTAVQRQKDLKEKTWVNSGLFALHPLTNEPLPIRYADYVLAGYGSGAVMSVPAHDERDYEFAKKFGLDIKQVILPKHGWWIFLKKWDQYLFLKRDDRTPIYPNQLWWIWWHLNLVSEWNWLSLLTLDEYLQSPTKISNICKIIEELSNIDSDFTQISWLCCAYWAWWNLINSWDFNWLSHIEAQSKIIDHLESAWVWRRKVTYKLRDRSVSRQRYWGSPIPIWYDEEGNHHLVPESELPVVLPLDLEEYQPSGKSPLEDHPTFPAYGEKWTRECDTLDTFMCSSFYFLRFPDAGNPDELIRKELAEKVLPVDFYSGGKEHSVGHLLYSRFIHKFLYDQWYMTTPEPFTKLIHQGMVLGEDGRKMGKRYGNGVDPLDVVEKYGADAVRTYLMFMGPVEADKPWSDTSLNGVAKFLRRVEALLTSEFRWKTDADVESLTHETIAWITSDLENLKLNTCVSKLMILVNMIYEKKAVSDEQLGILAQLLAPFATELAEKIRWELGHTDDVHYSTWPIADTSKIVVSSINLPLQINGKMRGKMDIEAWLSEEEVVALAKEVENIQKRLEGKELVKVIWVQDKILNLIVK